MPKIPPVGPSQRASISGPEGSPTSPQKPALVEPQAPTRSLDTPASAPRNANMAKEVPLHAGAQTRQAAAPPENLVEVLKTLELKKSFSAEVNAEVDAILANPGIDDPALEDLTALPFVTIDNLDSKDLDQAMYIRKDGDGYEVFYAIADAAHYIKPGSALFEEALARGTSHYPPGEMVPMLPSQLSAGIISLNQGVDRRALVFKMKINAQGECTSTDISRARIQSQKKLTYEGVQEYHNNPKGHGLAGQAFTETLDLLKEVGELRIARAQERDVVRYDRLSYNVVLQPDGTLRPELDKRNDIDMWNEQLSLLCNEEGAKILAAKGELGLYRVHAPPAPERLDSFEKTLEELVHTLSLPNDWLWKRQSESLAQYIKRLPREGEELRLTMAIQRQAMMLNNAAEFSTIPSEHDGTGAEPYARLSAPMREIVGVVSHILLVAALENRDPGIDRAFVEDVIAASKAAKAKEKALEREVERLAIDDLLGSDLPLPLDQRPLRVGTVMGMSDGKIYVQLDDPPIEIKLYIDELRQRLGNLTRKNVNVLESASGEAIAITGTKITLRMESHSQERDRWIAIPVV